MPTPPDKPPPEHPRNPFTPVPQNPLKRFVVIAIVLFVLEVPMLLSERAATGYLAVILYRLGVYSLFLLLYFCKSRLAWHSLFLCLGIPIAFIIQSYLIASEEGWGRFVFGVILILPMTVGALVLFLKLRLPYARYLETGDPAEQLE